MSDKPLETPAAETKPAEAVEAPAAVEATPSAAATTEETKPAETAPTAAAEETKPAETAPTAAAEETKPAETTETPAAPTETAAAAEEDKPAVPEKPTVTPIQALYAAQQEHGHPEIWGVTLADPATHVPSQIVFQKYLNANDGDLAKAKDQLLKTLAWRQTTKPLELLEQAYNRDKFAGLGYVTSYHKDATGAYNTEEPETKEVFTWNVYGNTKSIDKTFGDLQEFLHWRVALMELALQDLNLSAATKQITAEFDPYKIFQVHDYKSISFLRQSQSVKAASAETIKVFAQNYPELLKEKFFVNVPAIMGFVYSFMKLFVAAKTIKKFHPMSNGGGLAAEFGSSAIPDLGQRLPKEYGGKAADLKSVGKETKLEAAPVEEAPKEAAKGETPAAATATTEEPAKPTEEAAAAATADPVAAAAPVETAAAEPAAEAAESKETKA